jgi:multisubunit Na+/H+ antiporter MnhE subunit
MRHTRAERIRRFFYIHSDAQAAVFMSALALIELICWAALPEPISYAALIAAFVLAVGASCLFSDAYHQARRMDTWPF